VWRESHPREWVDRSSPAYRRYELDGVLESHPREWVDCSSAAYIGKGLNLPEIPPTGVRGLFTSSLQREPPARFVFGSLSLLARRLKSKTGIPGAAAV
jgi:hypothetical protein